MSRRPPSRALTAGDSRSGVSTASPAIRVAAARIAAMPGMAISGPGSEAGDEVIEHTLDLGLVKRRRMADAGHRHGKEVRLGGDHALQPLLGQKIVDSAGHARRREVAQGTEQ